MYRGRGPIWRMFHYDFMVITDTGDHSVYWKGDIVTSDPQAFKVVVTWFHENHHRLASLVNTYIEYDMPMLVYTHAGMDRRLARLKKLLKIIGNIIIKSPDLSPSILMKDIYPIQLYTIREIIWAMELVKDEVHRIRDQAHQLLYPRLLNALESLMRLRIWYEPGRYGKEYQIKADFEYNRYIHSPEHHFQIYFSKWRSKTLEYEELIKLIDKILERKEREMTSEEPKQALHLISLIEKEGDV